MLKEIFQENKWGIIFTYFLTICEVSLESSIPYLLGITIDKLLVQKYEYIACFAIPFTARILIGTFRRSYDTRVFSNIYKNKAIRTINNLKNTNLDKKRISIRYGLVGLYSDFFEHTLPNMVRIVIYIIISLLLIAFIKFTLLMALIPFLILMFFVHKNYGNNTKKVEYLLQKSREDISHALIDDLDCDNLLENQKDLFIRKSDLEAENFFKSDTLALFVEIICILIVTTSGMSIGEITSVVMYFEMISINACNGFLVFANFKLVEMTNDLLGKSPDE